MSVLEFPGPEKRKESFTDVPNELIEKQGYSFQYLYGTDSESDVYKIQILKPLESTVEQNVMALNASEAESFVDLLSLKLRTSAAGKYEVGIEENTMGSIYIVVQRVD